MFLQAPYRRETDSNIVPLGHMRAIMLEYTLVFHLSMKHKYVEICMGNC